MSTLTSVIAPDRATTAEDLIAAVRDMRDRLRAQQDEAEELGGYTEAIHEELLAAGAYHLLTPKRFGGLEMSTRTFAQVVIEVAHGDPGSGWCYSLGHGHAMSTAAWWPAEAQEEAYSSPRGYFRASQSMPPSGTAKKVDGGYIINARSPYQSGSPYSTHATVHVMLEGGDAAHPTFVHALVPEAQFTRVNDWGGDAILGMRSSGSNSVLVESQFVPEGNVVSGDWLQSPELSTSPGVELHGNPLYLGVPQTFLMTELAAVMVGSARAALDEYEEIIRSRTTLLPPRMLRSQDPQHQRDFGTAKMMTDSAETIVLAVNDVYAQRCTDAVEGRQPYTRAMDIEGFGQLVHAADMASEAVELLYRSAGASAAKKGQRMQRYMRDIQMYRTHNVAQYGQLAQRIGAVNLGEATSIY
ncbi:acyl-CoA dehydrogenase family protein [Leifsonia kafniensis]|uniref:Acyl-CoA dehydrogenase family protein n=1 Tax=Leifsonia kafniensis TaxID=475957 RepID=A0ABP7KUF9_9MICO